MTIAEIRKQQEMRKTIASVLGGRRSDGEIDYLLSVVDKLADAMEYQIGMWLSLPGGIEEDPDPDDPSPSDLKAHTAGMAVREARAVLKEIRS